MQQLGMAGGRFEVALSPVDAPQAFGLESAELRVAGHAGSSPRGLVKVASGGELYAAGTRHRGDHLPRRCGAGMRRHRR